MKLEITRETTGWATSETSSQRSLALEPIEHVAGDRPDALLVVGDPLRREATLEERLTRSCLGGSWPMNIARTSSSGKISANTVTPPTSEEYVSQSRLTAWTSSAVVTDQKPASSGYWSIFRRPVHGALAADPLEQLIRGPVLPQLARRQLDVLDPRFNGRHVIPSPSDAGPLRTLLPAMLGRCAADAPPGARPSGRFQAPRRRPGGVRHPPPE